MHATAAPARWYNLSAVVVFHIPKTGGTSMRAWMGRTYGSGALTYSDAACFFFLHRDIFTRYQNRSGKHVCGNKPTSAMLHRKRLSIEFHMWSEWRFWHELMPRAAELRERYARAGGVFMATTLLRAPRELVLSAYRYSRPTVSPTADRGNRSLLPLRAWLLAGADENARAGVNVKKNGFPQASGIITRSLTCSHPGTLGCSAYVPPARRGAELCNSSLALAHLLSLDVVCLLPNLSHMAAIVARRTSSKFRRPPHLLQHTVRGQSRSTVSTTALQPAETLALDRAAACDERLFELMKTRRMDVGAGCWSSSVAL